MDITKELVIRRIHGFSRSVSKIDRKRLAALIPGVASTDAVLRVEGVIKLACGLVRIIEQDVRGYKIVTSSEISGTVGSRKELDHLPAYG